MRSRNRQDFFVVLGDSGKLWIIVTVVFINLGLFVLGRIYLNPYLSRKPCVECGRPNTKAVNTLWQYEVKIVPYCKDVKLWYCKKHVRTAPKLVKNIPSEKDTIAKRYIQAVIGGVLQMITFLYAIILLKYNIKLFFISPAIIGTAFIIGNTTSSFSLSLLFSSIVIVPGQLFYLWIKQGKG